MKKGAEMENKTAIVNQMLWEIAELAVFFMLSYAGISIFFTLPILAIALGFHEYKIKKLGRKAKESKNPFKVMGTFSSFLGIAGTITFPFLQLGNEYLGVFVTLAVFGVFILLLSKFYEPSATKVVIKQVKQ